MDAWSECKGQWRKSALYLKMSSRKSSSSFGSRRWLTRNQLVAKYNDASLADSICDGKLGDEELKRTHTKPHPDCPGNEAGIGVHSSVDISGPNLLLPQCATLQHLEMKKSSAHIILDSFTPSMEEPWISISISHPENTVPCFKHLDVALLDLEWSEPP